MNKEPKKILVVEDEIIVRTSLIMFLESFNYMIFERDDGESALEFLSENRVHLIIADMRLPGINGEKLIQKAHQIDKNLKFIIYTGSSEYTLPAVLLEIGITKSNIIHKPVSDLHEFKRMIDHLLKNHSS